MRPPRRNFKLTIAYDGTRFGGWQRQPHRITIQESVEAALAKLAGQPVTVHGSGRTDAGVHARAQVASCSLETSLSALTIRRALNANLPEEIRVVRVQPVASDFHARFSARGKEYRYQIDCGPVADPFRLRYAWHHPRPLDVAAMRRAARVLAGRHDFTAFCAKSERDPVRTIHRVSVMRHGSLVTIAVCADGFLYKMVRTIVGALVKVGEGGLTAADVARLLRERKRIPLVETAPAKGLWLWRVRYGAPGTRRTR
jgi:tRNA pseudouridine38-40 synthase